MKILAPSLLFLLSLNIALASDFRERSFGESCEGIEVDENPLGSSLDPNNTRSKSFGFDAVYLDRFVKVGYFCSDENKFIKGIYWFKFSSKSEQFDFLEVSIPQLTDLYGEPESNSLVSVDSKKDDLHLHLFWINGDTKITALLSGNFDGPNSEKSFTIVFAPNE